MKSFYRQWWSIGLIYLITVALLAIGATTGVLWPLWLATGIFTIWDGLWISSGAWGDRTALEILESSTRARTYMSYFVSIYGAALAYFLLRLGEDQQKEVLALIRNAGVPLVLFVLPFALQSISMLFFPISLGQDTGSNNVRGLANKVPTAANLAMLVIAAWVEKVTTFCFLYAIIMLGSSIGRA